MKGNVTCAVVRPFLALDTSLPDSLLLNPSSITGTVNVNTAVLNPLTVPFNSLSLLHAAGLMLVSSLSATLVLARRRVLLSGDIEQNPGPDPVNSDKTTEQETAMAVVLGDSFKKLENALQTKLDTIISQISSQSLILKQQEEAMRNQGELLRQQGDELKKFSAEQERMKETVSGLCSEVEGVKVSAQKNEHAIGAVSMKQDRLNDTVESLEAEIDRLECFSRRNNVKFFGIPEASPGEREDCAEAVINLLQTYIPNVSWGPETIERAHRLGRFFPNRPSPRPIIAKFQSWRDAIRVMKDRSARSDMENDGVRAAQDLTRRQVESLKRVRAEGKVGYFVNGQLRIRDDQSDHRSVDDNNDDDGRDDVGRRWGRGYNARGHRGRGRGNHVSQQQHSNASKSSLVLIGSVDPTPSHDQPVSESHTITDVTEARDDTGVEGNPIAGDLNRPRTRSVSTRQVTMTESWRKRDLPSTRAGSDVSKTTASANGKK